MRHLTIVATALVLVHLPAAHADQFSWTWAPGSYNPRLRAAALSFPPGNAYTEVLERSMIRFNNNPSEFWYWLTMNDTNVGFNNAQHEIWFYAGEEDEPPIGITTPLFNSSPTQLDIYFNTAHPWTSSDSRFAVQGYEGTGLSFWAELMHELVHGTGMRHETDTYNVLGDPERHLYLNGNTYRTGPGEDACDGLADAYGVWSGAGHDLAVTHWKRTGSGMRWPELGWDISCSPDWSSEYESATHGRTILSYTSGTELPFELEPNGEKRYIINRYWRDQRVRVQFSYENNGRSTQTVDIGFYISTNNTISSSDWRIAEAELTVGRNTVWTHNETITIPWMSPGDRHLGVIIDDGDSVDEVTESNNAAYIPIEIR